MDSSSTPGFGVSTTTAPPLAKGDVFEVINYIGETDHKYVGRYVCSWVGDYHVSGYGLATAFMFSEVRRVEPAEQERGMSGFLLEDGHE